jgi:hypothetical protein
MRSPVRASTLPDCGGRAMKRTSLPLRTRRELITLIGAAAAWPVAARAQQTVSAWRVGFIGIQPRDTPIYVAFRKRMAELGYPKPSPAVTRATEML